MKIIQSFSFFIPIIILSIASCTTSPEYVSLSGTIHLEGQTDHSGIVIGLYDLAELDPNIVEVNNYYPHIGVIINQHTEFDHRFGNLVKSTTTNTNGNFVFSDVHPKTYNVVAIKDSFGFKYTYNVNISEGKNSLPTHTLYPETYISSDIDSQTIWQTDRHYIIEDDVDVDAELTIQPGAIIRIEENKEIIIDAGILNAVGEENSMIWFTKNDGFTENLNEIVIDDGYSWHRTQLESSSQAEVQWCKFDYAGTGLCNKINGFSISDCIFRNSLCGFYSQDVDSAFCRNLLCENITNVSEGGIQYNDIVDGVIEKNILYKCRNLDPYEDFGVTGVKVEGFYRGFKGCIKNNMFLYNDNGAALYWCSGEVRNNYFANNNYIYSDSVYAERFDIRFTGNRQEETNILKIEYNVFNSENGIEIFMTNSSPYKHFNFLINNNNFFNENKFIFLYDYYDPNDIDATDNYFNGLGNSAAIYEHISYGGSFDGEIDITSFETFEIANAGIEPE